MAIRKDIDDMLNNLNGNTSESPTPENPVEELDLSDPEKLDNLLTTLIGDSETAEEIAPKPKPRKMKIVINHELPDYEAIRQEDLRKNAEMAEQAEREAAEEARKAHLEAERRFAEEAERKRLEAEQKLAEEAEKRRLEAERKAQEEAEKARLEAERKAKEEAELARIEAKRRADEEAKRVAHLEAQRIAMEEAEKARLEAEQKAREEAEMARLETERKAREEAERERLEAERKAQEEAEIAHLEAERRAQEEAELAYYEEELDGDDSQIYNSNTDDDTTENPPAIEEKQEYQFLKNAPLKEEKPKPAVDVSKESFTSVLHNILDENPDEIMNQRNNMTEFEDNSKKGGIKKFFYATFGVIFAILACVGLVTVITKGIDLFTSYSSGETRKEGFEEVLYPAVIMDIESFNSPTELPSEQILTAAIWSMIMSDGIIENYELTFDVVTIPATDVESYAVKLFGDNLPELTHTTVGPAEARFYYNEETKSYNVPVAPVTYTYTPKIKEATKNGNEYIVKVDYIDELPAWLPLTSSKSVQFTLAEVNGEYQIKSMKILATSTSAV